MFAVTVIEAWKAADEAADAPTGITAVIPTRTIYWRTVPELANYRTAQRDSLG